MSSKYNNTPVVVDGIRFDSIYESRVYQTLRDIIAPYGNRYVLECQPKILIYRGNLFPDRWWKCDFRLTNLESETFLLIEAKGRPDGAFSYLLYLFGLFDPFGFDNLIIVHDGDDLHTKLWGTVKILPLLDLRYFLRAKTANYNKNNK